VSDQETPLSPTPAPEDQPDPAREALHKPHLSAEELEKEIGDSEPWDEDSQNPADLDQ
jgi:hypothetical protein